MLVACKACKRKNERDDSFKVVAGGKNQYYCNEKEYLVEMELRAARLETFQISEEILGKTTNTILYKEMTEIANIHTYIKISSYLKDNKDKIQVFMNKPFNGEYGKIKYFTTIIKNNIGDYVQEIKVEKKVEVETTKVNYKPKPKKKSLSQYTDEYEEG